jgi:HD-GYP domain-containing protein (c-di-GMP phosphodiesterase class II)
LSYPQRPVPKDCLRSGFILPGAICDARKQVLIPAGRELTDSDVQRLLEREFRGLFMGPDWDVQPESAESSEVEVHSTGTSPKKSNLHPISIDQLRPGMSLPGDLYDADGVLLLKASNAITERFLKLLEQFPTTYLRIGGETDRQTAAGIPQDNKCLDESSLWQTARELLADHVEASTLIQTVSARISDGGMSSARPAEQIVDQFYGQFSRDHDLLLAIVGLQESLDEYLFDHSVNVSMTAMSLAVRLGLSERVVREIGLAGLFQDLGMLQIPAHIRLARRPLAQHEQEAIRQHPNFSVDFLRSISGLSEVIPTVVLQAHERLDGSGYPNGLSGSTISLHARILGIADVYCAMIRPRPHRTAVVPHVALRKLLEDAHAGRFDRHMLRIFLDMQSAFGIGSLVELSDGSVMRVARANSKAHTCPVVITPDPVPGIQTNVINLAQASNLRVVKAVAAERSARSSNSH